MEKRKEDGEGKDQVPSYGFIEDPSCAIERVVNSVETSAVLQAKV
jgi:hypothetical protein